MSLKIPRIMNIKPDAAFAGKADFQMLTVHNVLLLSDGACNRNS